MCKYTKCEFSANTVRFNQILCFPFVDKDDTKSSLKTFRVLFCQNDTIAYIVFMCLLLYKACLGTHKLHCSFKRGKHTCPKLFAMYLTQWQSALFKVNT